MIYLMANKIGEENKTLGPTKGSRNVVVVAHRYRSRRYDTNDDEDAIKCLGKHQTRGK